MSLRLGFSCLFVIASAAHCHCERSTLSLRAQRIVIASAAKQSPRVLKRPVWRLLRRYAPRNDISRMWLNCYTIPSRANKAGLEIAPRASLRRGPSSLRCERSALSLRAQRSNPLACSKGRPGDCFVATLLAMTLRGCG